MGFVEVSGLIKRFGRVVAVDGIDLSVEKGELVTLLGPSGCGKTTTLRCIAGLERPDEGEISIGGRIVVSVRRGIFVPSSKRNIGMVFQNYAVWPHMKVFDNIAYGLKIHRVPKSEIRRRVKEVLELVGLVGLEDRYPTELSGGQQQRVALARALVRKPEVLLLDEPLSNLDAKLRERMRFEIRSLVKRVGITAIYVTHDQSEAMVISDRVVVMNMGRIMQVGRPEDVYRRPANRFVADFIGITNLIPGKIGEVREGGEGYVVTDIGIKIYCHILSNALKKERVYVSIRPEDIKIVSDKNIYSHNVIRGVIKHRAYLGNIQYYWISVDGLELRVQTSPELSLKEGDYVWLYLSPEKCTALP